MIVLCLLGTIVMLTASVVLNFLTYRKTRKAFNGNAKDER